MFGKKQPASTARSTQQGSGQPPHLYPAFYDAIARRLADAGGSETTQDIAFGVGNAIYNTVTGYLERTRDRRGLRVFEQRFEDRTPEDVHASDEMIAWLADHEGAVPEFIDTLLGRLSDVLGRPA